MKRTVLTLAVAVLMSMAANAQDNQQGPRHGKKFDKTEMVKHRTNEVVKKYQLNDQQAQQLLDLNMKYADKMGPGPRGHHRHGMGPGHGPKHGKDSLRKRQEAPQVDGTTQATPQHPSKDGKRPEMTEEQKAKMESMRQQREADMKAYDAELQKILTPEQYKTYQADMEKQRQRGPRHAPEGRKGKK